MSRADRRAQYKDALAFHREPFPHVKTDRRLMVNHALLFARGKMHDFRFGVALCALLGISTCTGKELLT